MSYQDGYSGTVMGTGIVAVWPGVNSMDAPFVNATKTQSPTNASNQRVILRSITPLKKTANGTVNLTIQKGDGSTAYTGMIFTWGTDAVNFMPKTIELDIELTSGLSFIKDSNNMDFLIVHEIKHDVTGLGASYGKTAT
jgi:hypothetical protein